MLPWLCLSARVEGFFCDCQEVAGGEGGRRGVTSHCLFEEG